MVAKQSWMQTAASPECDDADEVVAIPETGLPTARSTNARRAAVWERIKAHIDEHLGDPSLSARTIAAATYVSKRQLYRVFQTNQTTVTEWIRDRRLERCYRDLLHPGFAHRTVAEIAYSWGFAGPSHFSRAFRLRYGQCPSQFRADAVQGSDSTENQYAHLIACGHKAAGWLEGHYDPPPVPGQVGNQQLRVLMDALTTPGAGRHVICNWIDRRELNPRNLPSGLSHEAVALVAGMNEAEYEEYVTETSAVPAHVHPVDELLFFIGTNPRQPDVLGAEVELCLGECQERHLVRTTTAVWIPAGLRHCPLRIRRIDQPFVLLTILENSTYDCGSGESIDA